MKRKFIMTLLIISLATTLIACNNNTSAPQKNSTTENQVTDNKTSESSNEPSEEDSSDKDTEKSEPSSNPVYGLNEEAVIKDNAGKEMYSLKIDNVKSADEFIKDNNDNYTINGRVGIFQSEYKQAVEVTYTYKNIAKDDEANLYIPIESLQVADSSGNVGEPG